MRLSKGKIISVAVCALISLAAAVFFLTAYPFHFFHREHYTLFLTSVDFVSQMFSQGVYHPRQWLPTIAGEWLTQFFYYVGGGPIVVGVALMLLGLAVARLIRRLGAGWALSTSVAAVVMIWEAGRQCEGAYPLSSSLSLLAGAALASLYPVRGTAARRYAAAAVICAMGLTSIGYGGAVAIGYVLVAEAIGRRWPMAAASLVALAFVPYEGFRGGCWVGMPNMTSEAIVRTDVKTFWGKSLTADDFPEAVRNVQISNCLHTLSQIRAQGDATLDKVDWDCTQLFIPVNSEGNHMAFTAAGEVWYALGDMTMAEHATILGMIFSPAHCSSRHVKRLAEIAMARGDKPAAAKYLRILSHTLPHSTWAAARMSGEVPSRTAELRNLMPRTDTLRASADYRTSLRNLLETNPANALARTYLLALDMQQKHMADFAEDYLRYGRGVMTRAYAEALMVVLATSPADVRTRFDGILIPSDVWRDFERFNRLMERGDVGAMRREFAGSYWLYCQKNKR